VTRLGEPVLGPLVAALAGQGSEAVEAAVGWLLGLVGPERAAVAAALAAHPAPVQPAGDDRDDPFAWVARLAGAYPDDPAMVAPLLLNLVRLAPGEAVHLPAGNLHAYLEGAGVEVMATSDNVLRGGLTPKHVDAAELRRVLHFAPGPPPTVAPGRPAAGVRAYDAGEPAFALMALAPTEAGGSIVVSPGGPALLLATGGRASVQCGAEALELAAGRAVFVGAGEGPVEVSGPGTVWWATSGTAPPR
ncbi:MAG: manA, partial [Acidimicrobiales bacterium]|nr:manA [Acidimicrobiales bacterium]